MDGWGMRHFKNRFGDKGAALIEAAMIIPILLLFTFGIWATARAWSINNTLEHAAREGARYGATIDPWVVGTSPGTVRGIVDADLQAAAITPGTVNTVCIELIADGSSSCDSPATINNTTGTDQIFVKIEMPNHQLNFLFFSMSVDLSGTAVARYES
jgi:hypothetical protein